MSSTQVPLKLVTTDGRTVDPAALGLKTIAWPLDLLDENGTKIGKVTAIDPGDPADLLDENNDAIGGYTADIDAAQTIDPNNLRLVVEVTQVVQSHGRNEITRGELVAVKLIAPVPVETLPPHATEPVV